MLVVGYNAADRMRVAEMPIGAEHAGDCAANGHAALHLRDSLGVVLAENFHVGHDALLC
jgi:hypothetical protein